MGVLARKLPVEAADTWDTNMTRAQSRGYLRGVGKPKSGAGGIYAYYREGYRTRRANS